MTMAKIILPGKGESAYYSRLPRMTMMKIIGTGKGHSAYYTEEALRKAADDRIFPSGMRIVAFSDSIDSRVEEDLGTCLGVLAADAAYRDDLPSGSGLYAAIQIFADADADFRIAIDATGDPAMEAGCPVLREGLPVLRQFTSAERLFGILTPK